MATGDDGGRAATSRAGARGLDRRVRLRDRSDPGHRSRGDRVPANDQIAAGLLLALHEAGRPVPDELSVVGFDDVPVAAYLVPPLTTVRQDFGAVGRQAVEALSSAIAGSDAPAPSLIVASWSSAGARTSAIRRAAWVVPFSSDRRITEA